MGVLQKPYIPHQGHHTNDPGRAVRYLLRLRCESRVRQRAVGPSALDNVSGHRHLAAVDARVLPASAAGVIYVIVEACQLHPTASQTHQLVGCSLLYLT